MKVDKKNMPPPEAKGVVRIKHYGVQGFALLSTNKRFLNKIHALKQLPAISHGAYQVRLWQEGASISKPSDSKFYIEAYRHQKKHYIELFEKQINTVGFIDYRYGPVGVRDLRSFIKWIVDSEK